MADFRIKDNSDKVLKALQEQIELGLEAIGIEAQRNAVRDCPVDTGRLRNSITWAIKDKQGQANTKTTIGKGKNKKDAKMASAEDHAKLAEPEKNTMYLGTNVEYAYIQEFGDTIDHEPPDHGGGKAHFLRDAIATHGRKFKAIMKAALQDRGI